MIITAAIEWSVDPQIFTLGDSFGIRYYGVLFALGFVIGYQFMSNVFKAEGRTQKQLDGLSMTMVIATVVGARLGHCLFYEPERYLADPISILKVWEGGLASHGAGIAIPIAIWLFSRRQKDITFFWVLDRLVIVIALAGSFIRLGNFFNSEIYGLPADVPWAVIFSRIDDVPRHPVQLYESVSYLVIAAILFLRYKALRPKVPEGHLLGLFLLLVFGARFFLEVFKVNQAEFIGDFPLNMGQMLSIPFVIAGFALLFRAKRKG